MKDQRPRMVSYLLLLLVVFLAFWIAERVKGVPVEFVGTTNDLTLLSNPNTTHSNTLVTTEGALPGDGTMAVWTWAKGKVPADFPANTVLDSLTHPGEGVFVKNPMGAGGGGTNIFNTIITTNLYITTNTYIINNGSTNQVGLWELIGVAGVTNIQPADLNGWQPMTQIGWFAGTNSQAFWGGPLTNGEAFASFRDTTAGEPNYQEWFVGVGDNSNNKSSLDVFGGTNTWQLQFSTVQGSTNSAISFTTGFGVSTISQTVNGVTRTLLDPVALDGGPMFKMDSYNSHTTGNLAEFANNGTNQIAFGPLAQINFGQGGTNVLMKATDNLVYTNGVAQGDLVVRNLAGTEAHFGITAANRVYIQPLVGASGTSISDGTTTNDMTLIGGALISDNSNLNLGSAANMWKSLYLTNQIVWGPGTTNVMYRSGSDIIYTNGSTQVEQEIRNGAGRSAFVGFTSSGQVELRSANGATAIWLDNGTDKAVLFGGGLSANTDVRLGLTGTPWHGLYLTNEPSISTNYIYFGTNQMSVIGTDLYWNGVKLN